MTQVRKPPAPAPKKPEPKPAPPPPPKPVEPPSPAEVKNPEPAKPEPKKPDARPKPEPKKATGAADRGKAPAAGERTEAKPDAKTTHPKPKEPDRQATEASAGSPPGPGELSGDQAAQEIEVLRQQVGDLQFGSTWQAADPPKSSGKFGLALQGVEVGNNLRQAGRVLTDSLSRAAGTTGRIVTLVKAHKPPTYEVKK